MLLLRRARKLLVRIRLDLFISVSSSFALFLVLIFNVVVEIYVATTMVVKI